MTKTLNKQTDHELIFTLLNSYSLLVLNYNSGRGTQALTKRCANLEAELLRRGLLTEEEIGVLQS